MKKHNIIPNPTLTLRRDTVRNLTSLTDAALLNVHGGEDSSRGKDGICKTGKPD